MMSKQTKEHKDIQGEAISKEDLLDLLYRSQDSCCITKHIDLKLLKQNVELTT